MCFLVDTMLQKTAKNYYILKTNVRQYICSSYYFTVPKLTLSILDDFHNSFYELYVVSPAVDFIVIEGENGQSQPRR